MNQTVPSSASEPKIYNRIFWLAFVANVLLVTANALTFRFAEFVSFLGGTEETTGRIVSFGLIGSLLFRAFLGQAMDHFGIRRIWILSGGVYLSGCLLILTSTDVGWQIYAARTVFVIGIAGMFAASVSHIQNLAPEGRRTEIIGTFGASGFLGMICGAQAGDLIFHALPEGSVLYHVLFGATLVLGVFHVALSIVLTKGTVHERPTVTPPAHKLVLRYWPANVLIVTLMMGLGFGVTMTFLTRYSTHLGLPGIRTFFTAYALSAFTMRILARKWSRTAGRHKLIVLGLVGHAVGQLLLTFVVAEWHLIPSALCCGFGHALLFPCVISLGAGAFPVQYRGTGTTITLAAVDMGTILTAPLLGWMIDNYGFHPMFYLVSGVLTASAVYYSVLTADVIDSDTIRHPVPVSLAPPVSEEPKLEPQLAPSTVES